MICLWRRGRGAQEGEQLVALLKHLDKPIPEQAIVVPKKSKSSEHQTAEQLVEVPTTVSFSSLQWTAEQSVDIVGTGRRPSSSWSSLSGWAGRRSRLLPGAEKTAALGGAQHFDIPVPHGCGGGGGLQGFSPRQNSAAFTAHLSGAADEVFIGVFALFTHGKKCEVGSALGVGTECGLYFMDASGSWRAHVPDPVLEASHEANSLRFTTGHTQRQLLGGNSWWWWF